VVPVGGGGLIAGVATVAAASRPGLDVFGVQTETYPSMVNALEGSARAVGGVTMAEGIAVTEPGHITLPIVRDLVREVFLVSEPVIEDAVNLLIEIEKVVVEGAGAAGVAALEEHRDRFAGRRVGIVLSGANIDPRLLASVIHRGLVRSGRLARVRVGLDDRPGTLAALLSVVATAGANLLEVQHQRTFADVPLRQAEVDLVVECMDAGHRDELIEAISSASYRVKLLPLEVL
jgi:threonine dehydratase